MKKLPNFLTLLRIILVPAIIAVFYIYSFKLASLLAFGIFILAALTDFLDGIIARKYNSESKFGAMMDPIADKLMIGAVLVLLLHFGAADFIPVTVIILRELLVSGCREFIASNNGSMPVTKLAKWKTTFQFIAILMLLFIPLTAAEHVQEVENLARILLWFAAFLTLITGLQYIAHTIKFTKGLK